MRNIRLLSIGLWMVAGCSSHKGQGASSDLAADDLAMSEGGDGGDLAVPGGGDGGDGGGGCIAGLSALTITPAGSTVTLNGGVAAPVTFSVSGRFSDGHSASVDPTTLTWTATRSDDTSPGTISGGVLQPNPSAGGTVTISATDGCVSGSTTVSFDLVVSLGDGSATGWSNAPTSTGAPVIVYPSDQTRFPRNIYRTLFQWRTQGFSKFRLTFAGPGSTVTVFTDGANPLCTGKTPAAGCWEADQTAWSYIAGSNAGGTVTWTLDALDTSGATPVVRRAPPITIGFSRRDVLGAIFYWSTTSAGVRRAAISDAVPEDYIVKGTAYSNPTNDVQCVACHVVSRDGKYMAAPVQSSAIAQSLWILQVTATAPPTPLVTSVANTNGHGFATISPDDNSVVAAWNGVLWRLDRATGAPKETLPLGSLKGTQPDWSPDNTQLVFATGSGDAPSGASLAVIPYTNPGWGTPTTLVPASGLSNLFPQFSPDGKWVAYVRGNGGHDDLTAELRVVASTGGATVELRNANAVINNVSPGPSPSPEPQVENSQPTWAPPGDLYWIAFNSQRAYGVVTPQGTQQIWVAAIDPAKLGTGADPSFPAFRLQFQGLTENNHRAYWTLDVRQPSDGGVVESTDLGGTDLMATCAMVGQACSPGVVDCCDPSATCENPGSGNVCVGPVP